jgi:voltage-gated potassium channel
MSQPPVQAPVADALGVPLNRRDITLAILGTVGRLALGFVFIFLLMRMVPNDDSGSAIPAIVIALVASTLYILFFRRQLRSVYRAKYPTLRAAEALVLVAAMFLAIFSMLYVMVSHGDPEAFTEPLTSFTSYYFALTVLATVGFGDITPVSTVARSITMVQMAFDIAFIAVLIRVMGGAAKKALEERAELRVKGAGREEPQ